MPTHCGRLPQTPGGNKHAAEFQNRFRPNRRSAYVRRFRIRLPGELSLRQAGGKCVFPGADNGGQ